MDSTLSNAIARSIPAAESGMWPLFALVVLIALIATLGFGPRALDSYRKWKYDTDPEKTERRSVRPCEEHTRTIKELQEKLAYQENRIADQEDEIAEIHQAVRSSVAELRGFIDRQFSENRESEQRERIALENRISSRFDSLTELIGQLGGKS